MKFNVVIEKAGFKGTATIDFPTRDEKMKLIGELKALGYGSSNEDEEAITDMKLALASRMGEVVEQRLVVLDVVFEETGLQITDKALLDVYSECQALIGVISNFILGGVSLGKSKS